MSYLPLSILYPSVYVLLVAALTCADLRGQSPPSIAGTTEVSIVDDELVGVLGERTRRIVVAHPTEDVLKVLEGKLEVLSKVTVIELHLPILEYSYMTRVLKAMKVPHLVLRNVEPKSHPNGYRLAAGDGDLAASLDPMERLELSGAIYVTPEFTDKLKSCRKLSAITVSDAHSVQEKAYSELFGLPHVEEVSIINMPMGNILVDCVAEAKTVRRLRVESCLSLDDNALNALAKSNRIVHIAIGNQKEVTDGGMLRLLKRTDIESMEMRDLDVTTSAFPDSARMKKILIDNCPYLDIAVCLRRMTSTLEEAILHNCLVSDDVASAISRLSGICKLDLSRTTGATETAIATLSDMPKITHLSLAECYWNSDNVMKALFAGKGFRELKVLDVSLCKGITAAIFELFTGVPRLEELFIVGCDSVTQHEITAYKTRAPCVRVVTVGDG